MKKEDRPEIQTVLPLGITVSFSNTESHTVSRMALSPAFAPDNGLLTMDRSLGKQTRKHIYYDILFFYIIIL